MLGVITIFRLDQVLSSKEDLDYSSLKHYRHNCTHRMTLDDMLTLLVHEISRRFSEPDPDVSSSSEADDASQGDSTKPLTRSNKVILQNESWLNITGKSPKRNVRKFYDDAAGSNNEDKKILNTRRVNCTGNPIFRLNYDSEKKKINMKGKGSRNSCAVCSKDTNVYCTGCHVWLCGPHVGRPDSSGRDVVICLASQVYCLNTCWSTHHKPGLDLSQA